MTRREADEATRSAQEKQVLEEGVTALQRIHAQVARGDFAVRARINGGPLMPIAVSLNLMLDHLSTLTQRGVAYEQLLHSIRLLQEALDRNTQGQPRWLEEQLSAPIATDLRPILMQLSYLQRSQQSHLQRLTSTITSMHPLMFATPRGSHRSEKLAGL